MAMLFWTLTILQLEVWTYADYIILFMKRLGVFETSQHDQVWSSTAANQTASSLNSKLVFNCSLKKDVFIGRVEETRRPVLLQDDWDWEDIRVWQPSSPQENLSFLGSCGIAEIHGLNVAFLSGRVLDRSADVTWFDVSVRSFWSKWIMASTQETIPIWNSYLRICSLVKIVMY